jgi:predicted molibdopterin-dependent oxidoreductase YjgC
LRDGGHEIGGSSSFSCGHCITVCPCNALMEKSMLGEAGFPSRMPKESLNKMIDVVKAIEPELGYGVIMQVSQNGARGWQIVVTCRRRNLWTFVELSTPIGPISAHDAVPL